MKRDELHEYDLWICDLYLADFLLPSSMISNFSAHSENESRLINCVQLMVRSFSIQSGHKCNGKTSQMCIVHSLCFFGC